MKIIRLTDANGEGAAGRRKANAQGPLPFAGFERLTNPCIYVPKLETDEEGARPRPLMGLQVER